MFFLGMEFWNLNKSIKILVYIAMKRDDETPSRLVYWHVIVNNYKNSVFLLLLKNLCTLNRLLCHSINMTFKTVVLPHYKDHIMDRLLCQNRPWLLASQSSSCSGSRRCLGSLFSCVQLTGSAFYCSESVAASPNGKRRARRKTRE